VRAASSEQRFDGRGRAAPRLPAAFERAARSGDRLSARLGIQRDGLVAELEGQRDALARDSDATWWRSAVRRSSATEEWCMAGESGIGRASRRVGSRRWWSWAWNANDVAARIAERQRSWPTSTRPWFCACEDGASAEGDPLPYLGTAEE
jgi:hypothetical protein